MSTSFYTYTFFCRCKVVSPIDSSSVLFVILELFKLFMLYRRFPLLTFICLEGTWYTSWSAFKVSSLFFASSSKCGVLLLFLRAPKYQPSTNASPPITIGKATQRAIRTFCLLPSASLSTKAPVSPVKVVMVTITSTAGAVGPLSTRQPMTLILFLPSFGRYNSQCHWFKSTK